VYILKSLKASVAIPVVLGMRNGPRDYSSAVCMRVPNQEISQYVTAFAEFQRTATLEHTLRSAEETELQSANLRSLLFTEFKGTGLGRQNTEGNIKGMKTRKANMFW